MRQPAAPLVNRNSRRPTVASGSAALTFYSWPSMYVLSITAAPVKVTPKMFFAKSANSWHNTLTALKRSKLMDGSDQIGSTLGGFVDAVLHPSVASLPVGFLVLVLAVLMIAALPEGARERMRLAGLTAVGLIVSLSLSWPVTSRDPALTGAGNRRLRSSSNGRLRAAAFYRGRPPRARRSIAGANGGGASADAADPEPMEHGVASGRVVGRPSQIGSELGHRFRKPSRGDRPQRQAPAAERRRSRQGRAGQSPRRPCALAWFPSIRRSARSSERRTTCAPGDNTLE